MLQSNGLNIWVKYLFPLFLCGLSIFDDSLRLKGIFFFSFVCYPFLPLSRKVKVTSATSSFVLFEHRDDFQKSIFCMHVSHKLYACFSQILHVSHRLYACFSQVVCMFLTNSASGLESVESVLIVVQAFHAKCNV